MRPDDFRFGISEQLLGAAVERFDDALGVDDDDAVDRGVENRVEPFGARIRRRRDLALGFLCGAQPVIEPHDDQPGDDTDAEQEQVRRIGHGERRTLAA